MFGVKFRGLLNVKNMLYYAFERKSTYYRRENLYIPPEKNIGNAEREGYWLMPPFISFWKKSEKVFQKCGEREFHPTNIS